MERRAALGVVALLCFCGCQASSPSQDQHDDLPACDTDACGDSVVVSDDGVAGVCGDGLVDDGEVCDDGNTTTETECAYGPGYCTACRADCGAVLYLSGRTCGDDYVDASEACDDGNKLTETGCTYGEATCSRCSADCSTVLFLTGPVCGDHHRDAVEACDDGNTVTETACPVGVATCTGCDADCRRTRVLDHCGNGAQDIDESDVDCGGSCTESCVGGAHCGADADCESYVCVTTMCTPADWHDLGGSDFGPWGVTLTWGSASGEGVAAGVGPRVVFDGAGRLVMAFMTSGFVHVVRLESDAWVSLDGDLDADAQDLALALDASGRLILAWSTVAVGATSVVVARLDDAGWTTLGTIGSKALGAPALAAASNGDLIVAWSEDHHVYVERFDAVTTAWGPLGASDSGDGLGDGTPTAPAIAVQPDGALIVVWERSSQPIAVKRFDVGTGTWVELGGIPVADDALYSTMPHIVLDSDSAPVVAWSEYNAPSTRHIVVAKQSPGGWSTLLREEILSISGHSLALDSGGPLVLALSTGLDVFVRQYDGSVWTAAANVSNTWLPSTGPSLAARSDGAIAVSWTEDDAVYVRFERGSGWEQVPVGNARGDALSREDLAAFAPDVVVAPDGSPIVSWVGWDTSSVQRTVEQFTGIRWIPAVFGPSTTTLAIDMQSAKTRVFIAPKPGLVFGSDFYPSAFTFDATGAPVGAWANELDATMYVDVRRFDGADWSTLGSWTPSSRSPCDVALTRDDGAGLVLASCLGWQHYDGDTWQPMPEPIDWTPDSVIADPTGRVLAAWNDCVQRFNWVSGAWEDLVGSGTVSCAGAGVATKEAPSLAVDESGRVILAWQDRSAGNWEIYVARFDGDAWGPIGASSASGGGVSNSTCNSFGPRVATANGRTCVTWTERGASATQVLLRCSEL